MDEIFLNNLSKGLTISGYINESIQVLKILKSSNFNIEISTYTCLLKYFKIFNYSNELNINYFHSLIKEDNSKFK
jgi:hypothetical protein